MTNPQMGQRERRVVRVFVSSTVRDMQEPACACPHADRERDHLVKYIFPELKRRCRERQVELVEVDLRRGVTEEQAERGEILPVCLEEIDRCRPYFLGLLGEWHGHIPEQIHPELEEARPGLKQHREQGVLEANDPRAEERGRRLLGELH
jgi:hypothetical protein